MKKQLSLPITLLFGAFSIVTCQRSFLDTPENIQLLRAFRELSLRLIGSSGEHDSRVYKEAKYQRRIQTRISNDVAFPCNTSAARSEVIPSSINQLRPGDIDVIAAMGDSLTAGFGIYSTDITNIFVENRGAAAFGGGQGTWRDTLTLPNIIKEFNPKVIGFAERDSWSHQPASRFNVAESISMSRDMPYMAKILINRMKNDPEVDIKKHWKLITIFIGSNDLCADMCWNPSAWASLENHKKDMLKTLRTLKRDLPRTFVSIVPPPNLRELVELKGRTELCRTTVNFECSCLFGLTWRNRRNEFYEIIKRWQQLDEEIGTYPEFQTEDFTVVVQPFPIEAVFPHLPNGKGDFRYLSSDCFHLSQLSNARAAFSGWRNLLEPIGKKTRWWDELKSDLSNFPCPTVERPYVATPEIEDLYGDRQLTYNSHQLVHLTLCVKRWGPLPTTSAFAFENYNGLIAKSVHGTKHFGQQIVNNVQITHGVRLLENRIRENSPNIARMIEPKNYEFLVVKNTHFEPDTAESGSFQFNGFELEFISVQLE